MYFIMYIQIEKLKIQDTKNVLQEEKITVVIYYVLHYVYTDREIKDTEHKK